METLINDTSRNTSQPFTEFELQIFHSFRLLLYTTAFIVGSIGNFLLAKAILSVPQFHSNNTVLLASLAIVDCLSCLLTLPKCVDSLKSLVTGEAMPIQWCFWAAEGPRNLGLLASTVLLLSVAYDRLLMLRAPLIYQTVPTVPYLGLWLLAALAYGFTIVGLQWAHLNPAYVHASVCEQNMIFQMSIQYVVPVVVLPVTVVTVAVCSVTLCAARRLADGGAGESLDAKRRKRRFYQSLRIVLQVYLLSFGSAMVGSSVVTSLWPTGDGRPPRTVHLAYVLFSNAAVYVNTCSNAFVYYWRNEEYRKVMRRTLGLEEASVNPLHATQQAWSAH